MAEFDGKSLEELQASYEDLRDEMMENDAQLALRRFRPTGEGSAQPIQNYQTWRAETVARTNELRRDMAFLKSLINERKAEAKLAKAPDDERRNSFWRRQLGYLIAVMDEIAAEPTASPAVLNSIRRAQVRLTEDGLYSGKPLTADKLAEGV